MDNSLLDAFRECGCELLDRFLPRVVLLAGDDASVARLISLAGKKRLRLCPTGTGSSLPANYQPPKDTVFLLTTGLNKVLELRFLDGVGVVEAGMLAKDLSGRLEGTDLEFPLALATYVGSLGGAMLGPDPAGLRHAEMRRRLLGVEMVDPQGQIVKFGSGSVKNVAGYDYWAFLVGTGGRFGVLTRLVLNLEKMPPLRLPNGTASHFAAPAEAAQWIYANLEKRLDPDGIFAR